MLRHLHIRDLVIVHELELSMTGGMSALTGETGAGKSILIDALGLALGARSDTALIRHGSERAEVCAEFELGGSPAALDWLREHELANGDDCMLRRVLPRTGRSRAFINGTPSPLSQLAELGRLLVDIHGQHANQSLVLPAAQRRLLDDYARHPTLQDACAAACRDLSRTQDELTRLTSLDDARLDYVAFQLEELESHDLDPAHIDELGRDQKRLANADALQTGLLTLLDHLWDGEIAVGSALSRDAAEAERLAAYDPDLAEAAGLLRNAEIHIEEAVDCLRSRLTGIDNESAKLQMIETELGALHDLARKHRVPEDELSELRDCLAREKRDLMQRESRRAELENQLTQQIEDFRLAATDLSQSRKAAAQKLSDEVSQLMQQLGMKGGHLEIQVHTDHDARPAASGFDQIEFRVAANPGQAPSPLASTASGGELSRIGLAIQVATTGLGEVPTLIFDEVDAGIGGAVAEIVGQLMRRLGTQRQVFCVTHLPQVACQAHHHFRVHKQQTKKSTETRVDLLDDEARIQETARMLGGLDISEQTIAHADEMLSRGRQ